MYPAGSAYEQAVKENTRKYFWSGRIVTAAGDVHDFGPDDIVKGSGYVTRQCCGSAGIEIGSVYAAEMGITLFSGIDRYTLMGAVVSLDYHLRVNAVPGAALMAGQEVHEGAVFQTIPLGLFEVAEVSRYAGSLSFKAYDYMLRFDREINKEEIKDLTGTAYDFMELCARRCGVQLAQARSGIEGLPNGDVLLEVYEGHDMATYRDILAHTAQVIGGYFVIDRNGRLELRRYGRTPVLTVEQKHRFRSSISDHVARYTAVSSTNMRTLVAEYQALDPDDGLTMNLGINPLIQFRSTELRRNVVRNILVGLQAAAYVPFESDTIGNPAIDMGDVIECTGGQAGASTLTCVTYCSIRIGGRQRIRCGGKNPRLAGAKSRNDKNISGLLAHVVRDRVGIFTFSNVEVVRAANAEARILTIDFVAADADYAQFFAEVVVDVTAPDVSRSAVAAGEVVIPAADAGTADDISVALSLPVSWTDAGSAQVRFIYEVNGEREAVHVPEETWRPGRHTILLYSPVMNVMRNCSNTFSLYMLCNGGAAEVGAGMCVGSITGQGMATTGAWDGQISADETVEKFGIGCGLQVRSFEDSEEMQLFEEMTASMADRMQGRTPVKGFGAVFVTGY